MTPASVNLLWQKRFRGALRADFFWGTGPEAGALAGRMRQPGRMWLLWPRGETLPRR